MQSQTVWPDTDEPVVQLDLPARPESIGVVRQALVGLADGLALGSDVLDDAKMAVTEACTNCVTHAFPGADGRFGVDMHADMTALTVVVHDSGAGTASAENGDDGPPRVGLQLIQALTDGFDLEARPGIGTKLSMRFDYVRAPGARR